MGHGTRYRGVQPALIALAAIVMALGSAQPAHSQVPTAGCQIPLDSVCESWVARYVDPSATRTPLDSPSGITMSPSGERVFVTGSSDGGTVGVTAAFDTATGTQLWAVRHPEFSGVAAVASPSGARVYVTGYHDNHGACGPEAAGSSGVRTCRYLAAIDTASGSVVWTNEPEPLARNSLFGRGWDLAISPGGERVYVTGSSFREHNDADGGSSCDDGNFVTSAYETGEPRAGGAQARAPGEVVWTSELSRSAPDECMRGYDIAASADGRFVVAVGESGLGAWTAVAYDALTGTRRWLTEGISDGGLATAQAVVIDPASTRIFVTGAVDAVGVPGTDYGTAAYDSATGEELWFSKYTYLGLENWAFSVAVAPAGDRVYVTGFSYSGGKPTVHSDYATVAYASDTGTQVWAQRYGSPDDFDGASTVVASPDGNEVYVTGIANAQFGDPPTGRRADFATVGYDAATGSQRWAAVFNADPDDSGACFGYSLTGCLFPRHDRSLVVSADGTRVVALAGLVHEVDPEQVQANGNGEIAALGYSPPGVTAIATRTPTPTPTPTPAATPTATPDASPAPTTTTQVAEASTAQDARTESAFPADVTWAEQARIAGAGARRIWVRGRRTKAGLRGAVRQGLSVLLTCECQKAEVLLYISPRAARRHGLGRFRHRVLVGRRTVSLSPHLERAVRVKFLRQTRRRLGRAGALWLQVEARLPRPPEGERPASAVASIHWRLTRRTG